MNAEEYAAITIFPTNFLLFEEKNLPENRIMTMYPRFTDNAEQPFRNILKLAFSGEYAAIYL
ncbi:hypothetical protein KDM87_08350 [Undibacterium sp. FT147W]|uniref:Uncharacterized protein n=1 Tax=Undibacterium rivi TaxID=2828729 RepID=A0ABS5H1L6_9BURK|nr:hypothetical protein [Undibacterium rivi]MBR7792601.1 hypothetical protein [Undibacterium rivi]